MGKPTGFIEFGRLDVHERPIKERIADFREIPILPEADALGREGARCMDCGTPYCHSLGCPVDNLIPEWNDAVYRGHWEEAWERLELTNNLPEITGRVCPAPCEASCTLSINDNPVSIKKIELAVAERAFSDGWAVPRPPKRESNIRIAIIGSGPAGLSAAQQLRRAGHRVTVYEKSEKIGGLLRYGIPDFKLEKRILDRRIAQMAAEGIEFETGCVVGEDLSARYIRKKYDIILLTLGAEAPRDLTVPGRDADGIHFAMEFLSHSNRMVSGEDSDANNGPYAEGKHVLVVGGGDTGSDCVGTSIRQGASKVTQIEIMPEPPEWHKPHNPEWPNWPTILRTSTSHAEGCARDWLVSTSGFEVENGKCVAANCVRVQWSKPESGGRPVMTTVPGSDFTVQADLVLLAMGFVHVKHSKLLEDFEVQLDSRGNIDCDHTYMTNVPGIFVAGDSNTGASLVVRAIRHGRDSAEAISTYVGTGDMSFVE